MKRKELKRALRETAEREVPDVRARIVFDTPAISAKQPEPKRRFSRRTKWLSGIAAAVACIAIVVPSVILTRPPKIFVPETTAVYLKINPAVELTAKEGITQSVRALNRDAAILLHGENLVGARVETACERIAALAQKSGYLTEEGIELTVSGADETSLLTAIAQTLDRYGAKTFQTKEDTVRKAARYGITPGKMWLVERLAAKNSAYREADLAKWDEDDLLDELEDYDEAEAERFESELEQRYRAEFSKKIDSVRTLLGTAASDLTALAEEAERNGISDALERMLIEYRERYAALGEKFRLPDPKSSIEDFVEDAQELAEEAEELRRESDLEELFEELFEDVFDDFEDDFRAQMKDEEED